METIKPKSAINNRSNKLAKTFHKVISFRGAAKIISSSSSSNGLCLLSSQPFAIKSHHSNAKHERDKARIRAIMEALIARLFAGVTAIKASYAELQMAQKPYNNEAIQAADQAVVDELRAISELKRKFVKKELDLSPQVTLMLAEIQEQQSLMKTYELTIKKLESEVELKESESSSLKKQLDECISFNKSLEKRLSSSGPFSMFDNLQLSKLNPTHFVQFLEHTLRAIKSFVKLMIREMESAHWDLQAAAKFIHPHAVFAKPSHIYFAFESFVCLTIFEGFNFQNFTVPNEPSERKPHKQNQNLYFEKFKKLKSLNPKQYLTHNPTSSFAKFLKSKYFQLVHAKMECSLFGNLNQRKQVNSGGFPDSAFFTSFAEMAKRVWDLHFLALSFDDEVSIFQVKKNSRFSEVYMECVNVAESESVSESGSEEAGGGSGGAGELRVSFTVVPGFKMDKTVVQSQVYLSPPAGLPATR
ncbi:protein GRAVITROPIC IN THE LIGHT 1-like isoform X2 [Neltuma alba]|uniref:protein GRAVITROPIC IN THE LIGHT 1-like isoform X1 n=1 Tax=Neltuma alba TaxID=207710 RepID=UPI0010A35DB6|nr:protein GRAVITROPIC IN THE LIGHT 1-like isoform X1 [Prosopis alba]XP_028755742.1 protein GRAVITROPIC IN THE LIGHT 1-like isoform X2 [Prosopis alba]